MSLYMDVALASEHGDALKHLDVGKSCIRFKNIKDLPLETVQQILIESVVKQKQVDERNKGFKSAFSEALQQVRLSIRHQRDTRSGTGVGTPG
jgi:hypothetical protein